MGFLKVAGLLLTEKTLPAMTTLGSIPILCRRLQKLASLVHGNTTKVRQHGQRGPARDIASSSGAELLFTLS